MGTSLDFASRGDFAEDHPHAYGDKQTARLFMCRMVGSSPRVWGQVAVTRRHSSLIRIIPTRMGTSNMKFNKNDPSKDHPHAYGDKKKTLADDSLTVGSSPRVWGQARHGIIKKVGTRIIPTRMGTSVIHAVATTFNQDHPHAYGDKRLSQCCYEHRRGSSPRVWGQVSSSS